MIVIPLRVAVTMALAVSLKLPLPVLLSVAVTEGEWVEEEEAVVVKVFSLSSVTVGAYELRVEALGGEDSVLVEEEVGEVDEETQSDDNEDCE